MRYLGFAKITFQNNLAYRTEFLLQLGSMLLTLLVYYFIWTAVFTYNSVSDIRGFSLTQMITYMSVAAIVNRTLNNRIDMFMEQHVRRGELTSILCQPINYMWYNLARNIGSFTYALVFRAVPGLLFAYVALGVALPTLSALTLFSVSLVFGMLLQFSFIFLTGLAAFWTSGSIWGLRVVRNLTVDFLGGSLVPLALFPEKFASIALALPFASIYHVPISMYLGNVAGGAAFKALGVQLAWAALFLGMSAFFWGRAHRSYTSQGG